jgi:hypothetical protein
VKKIASEKPYQIQNRGSAVTTKSFVVSDSRWLQIAGGLWQVPRQQVNSHFSNELLPRFYGFLMIASISNPRHASGKSQPLRGQIRAFGTN